MERASTERIVLDDANLDKSILDHADLGKSVLDHADLDKSVLDHADLDKSVLDHADLDKSVLDHADLDKSILDHADLDKHILDHADLDKSVLDDADLDKSVLDDTNLDKTVRFGRVPKREKARILAAMQQSSNCRSAEKAVAAELEDEQRLLSTVIRAHLDTCDFTRDKVEPMLAQARDQPCYTACPPTLRTSRSVLKRPWERSWHAVHDGMRGLLITQPRGWSVRLSQRGEGERGLRTRATTLDPGPAKRGQAEVTRICPPSPPALTPSHPRVMSVDVATE
uniref:Uncharacterized protein n=1 Tax=Timema monikensis TaxID=170555 RepID=A0A7R9HQ21_9NEOP|nr:unnamed protein product [Timema monikensis]